MALQPNKEMVGKACEIRIRAERRCGQLLQTREMAKGARGNPGGQGAKIVPSDGESAHPLSELGISYGQSSRWQKLAAIPEKEFEETFAGNGKKPSTAAILAAHKKEEPSPPPIIDVLEFALR